MSPPRRLAAIVEALTAETEPYLSCDECFDRICAYVEHVVADPLYEDVPMETHLRACGVCADEAAALLALANEDLACERGSPAKLSD